MTSLLIGTAMGFTLAVVAMVAYACVAVGTIAAQEESASATPPQTALTTDDDDDVVLGI